MSYLMSYLPPFKGFLDHLPSHLFLQPADPSHPGSLLGDLANGLAIVVGEPPEIFHLARRFGPAKAYINALFLLFCLKNQGYKIV